MTNFETQFDGLFASVMDKCGGIEVFLETIYSFLARRTDFFGPTMANSKIPREMISRVYEKYEKIAREMRVQKLASKKTEGLPSKVETGRRSSEMLPHPQVEDITDSVPSEKKTSTTACPVANGGVTDKYSWTQTLPLAEVFIPLAKGTSARQCSVSITQDSLCVKVNNEVLLDGKLYDKVKHGDSMWTLEDKCLLHIVLEKADNMKWWTCILKGDPEIDTQKIVPENSKLSDLDPELRQTVEKMMFDQDQKSRGLPTSDQLKQAELLEKFKQAHPEMDFSNAKVCNSNAFGSNSFQL